ncbi:class II fructose-bisphosphate aldolase [Granulicatella seriolae]|uniref:Class II fructose-bisphosphate aldolase n=1 Tax=Granulicatella seriolae TaxID=2967226 RepID=A0ABT1WN70_9LACT|nr:class II fructose-bisphosphate aldolase [Granulicatella seriolae]
MKASMNDVLRQARINHFAVPATNFIDLTTARAYKRISEKLQLPLILAYAQSHSDILPLEEAALIGKYIQKSAHTPVVLHLDHGQDKEFIYRAIELGFNSVMIDASLDSYNDNVNKTREIIDLAKPLGVAVEAEIGFVGANANLENHEVAESIYTTTNQAVQFVKDTDVDSLAISIGTAHGLYSGIPKINFDRLREIRNALSIPLVLHGGSSSGEENLSRCALEGISKINLFTDLIQAGYHMKEDPSIVDYVSLNRTIQSGIEGELERYYQVFRTKSLEV